MLRIRIQLPKNMPAQHYTHLDLIHDALIHAWIAAGAENHDVIGESAKPWTFAPLGWHRGHQGIAHSLVVSTASPELARVLSRLDPAKVVKRRLDEHSVNFANATMRLEPDPLMPGQRQLGCLLLSPLVLQDKCRGDNKKRWHTNLAELQATLSERLNRRLSCIAGRTVSLRVIPDGLYLRANPKHSVLVNLKAYNDGRKSFVLGMQAPLLLEGAEDDLRLAWYAGIGEKTRSGFGCLGLAEQGVGR